MLNLLIGLGISIVIAHFACCSFIRVHKAIVYACTYFESSSAVSVVQIHIYNIDSLCFHIKHKHSAWSIKNMTTQNFIHILFHCKWFCVRYPWHFRNVNKKDPFDIVNRTLLSILNSLNFLTFGLYKDLYRSTCRVFDSVLGWWIWNT